MIKIRKKYTREQEQDLKNKFLYKHVKDLDLICKVLDAAEVYCNQPEVVLSALNAMQKQPLLTIKQAMMVGYHQWVIEEKPENVTIIYPEDELEKNIN